MKRRQSATFTKKIEDNSPNDKNYRKVILVNTDLLHRVI